MRLIRQPGQQGSILITLIIAMTLMGVFGAGLYKLTSSSSFGQFIGSSNDDAYNLARAGLRYGVDLHPQTTPYSATFAFAKPDGTPDPNHTFKVDIATTGLITSTGVVNPNTFFESRRVLTYDASWAPPSTPYIGMPGVTSPIVNNPNAIVPNPTNKTINLGGNVPDSYGSIWYQGSSSIGNCVNGVCHFGTCLYAYFDFTFVTEDFSVDSTTYADGFTFALISAINNTRDRTGGARSGISQGELMGYAGPGNTTDMLGLIPPKMALEFDTYGNGNAGICNSDSRNDPTPFADHASLMFWGNRTNTACGGYPGASFDDNVHGAGGTGNDPLNPTRGDAGYYEGAGRTCKSSANTCNWLEDGYPYSVRVEIARPTPDTATSGTFNYVINAWIVRPVDAGFSAPQTTHFQDVTAAYTDSNPNISKTVTLSFQDHSDLSKIFFGFTEATGGSAQQITLSNLKVNFPSGAGPCTTAATCTYSLSPTSVTIGSGVSSGTVGVTAGTGCTWTAVSNDGWITVTGGSSGSGNGTVSYSVAANTGLGRTGTMTIGGQTFTVNQSGGCTYSLSPTSVTIGSGASTGTVGVTAGTGCTWTAVSNDGWITVTGGSSGSGNGTVSYSVAANTGPARTGTMTIGGQTFTVNQTGGCTYSLSPTSVTIGSGASTGTVGVTAGTGCTWTAASNDGWITVTGGSSGSGNGTVSYSVSANTGCSRTGTMTIGGQTFTVSQSSTALSITTASLPDGRRNVAYTTTTVAATGGATPYSWSASGLPGGLSINASTGAISGTPTTAGLYNPIVTVTDSCPTSANRTYNNLRIKNNTYKIYNSTGATIYRKSGSTCTNTISNGSSYSMAYNASAVAFYKNGNTTCGGSTISISGAQADAADANFDGKVQINSSWNLIDR